MRVWKVDACTGSATPCSSVPCHYRSKDNNQRGRSVWCSAAIQKVAMMIGLDTNVLVRYLTRDEEAQYRATMKLLTRKAARFFIADLVLVESDWVLSKF